MRIRVTNPNISSYQIHKISGRKNIGSWLTSKNIINWSFCFITNVFTADVPDTFDLSVLEQWGTVEVITDGT